MTKSTHGGDLLDHHSGEARQPSRGWAGYPNLLLRPSKPAASRGRLQRLIGRCFHVHGPEVSASTIYEWCETWPEGRR
jgi:hypothetical protein